jgi:hypothetical protein
MDRGGRCSWAVPKGLPARRPRSPGQRRSTHRCPPARRPPAPAGPRTATAAVAEGVRTCCRGVRELLTWPLSHARWLSPRARGHPAWPRYLCVQRPHPSLTGGVLSCTQQRRALRPSTLLLGCVYRSGIVLEAPARSPHPAAPGARRPAPGSAGRPRGDWRRMSPARGGGECLGGQHMEEAEEDAVQGPWRSPRGALCGPRRVCIVPGPTVNAPRSTVNGQRALSVSGRPLAMASCPWLQPKEKREPGSV